MAALIGGTNQKHPHIPLSRSRQSRAVVLTDVIPMQVDVIEGIAGDGLKQ